MADMKKESNQRLSDVMDAPITRAANNAARQVLQDEKRKAERREGCMLYVGMMFSHFFNGFLLMFVLALFGIPMGYFASVLIAYTAAMILTSGNMNSSLGILKILKELKSK